MKTGKLVFKPMEIQELGKAVAIEAPSPVVILKEDVEEEKIKTLQEQREELEDQIDQMKKEAESEALEIVENAQKEAKRIMEEADGGAFDHIKKATEKAKTKEEEAINEGERLVIQKKQEADKFLKETKSQAEQIKEEARNTGNEAGYKEGYSSGRSEIERLIKRLNSIIEGAIDKREKIISNAEEQVIRIILLITKKVVKAISREQEGIVIENIKAALEKIQGKEEVIIRVNAQDLELTTEHKEEFLAMLEGLKHVVVLEDSRIERGGCIIETDFGSVDARISTQLEELEDKIRDIAQFSYFEPVKKKVELKSGKGYEPKGGKKEQGSS